MSSSAAKSEAAAFDEPSSSKSVGGERVAAVTAAKNTGVKLISETKPTTGDKEFDICDDWEQLDQKVMS